MIIEKFNFYKEEISQFDNLEKWIDRLSAEKVAVGYPNVEDTEAGTTEEKEIYAKAKAQYIEDNTFTDEQIAELKKVASVVETESKK